jgi:Cu/Ag efflux pump CusA
MPNPMPITLDEAIRRAQAVETAYGAAVANAGVAHAAITGMPPLAFALGAGAQIQPLAIAVLGSLLISMILSLIVTPVVFFCLTKIRHHQEVHSLDQVA